ncbi:unnamed protein product [Mycena citricolor]|uniref:Uncharacterized protein n=1 Tax=Mycena citricolor TaxID=2018698 RepID=A0AAD2H6Z6_9AGAR|nr:unnamed protein product [Mycena citricolor]
MVLSPAPPSAVTTRNMWFYSEFFASGLRAMGRSRRGSVLVSASQTSSPSLSPVASFKSLSLGQSLTRRPSRSHSLSFTPISRRASAASAVPAATASSETRATRRRSSIIGIPARFLERVRAAGKAAEAQSLHALPSSLPSSPSPAASSFLINESRPQSPIISRRHSAKRASVYSNPPAFLPLLPSLSRTSSFYYVAPEKYDFQQDEDCLVPSTPVCLELEHWLEEELDSQAADDVEWRYVDADALAFIDWHQFHIQVLQRIA